MNKNIVTVRMSPEVFHNIIALVTEELNNLEEEQFDTRREFLGYIAEMSEILDAMKEA